MLLELRAENYAVIDHAVAVFGPGLNLLTGETGAGKSILIDALVLLLGGKASSDLVRFGAEKAVLGCVFESTIGADAILERNGIDPESGEILLRREIGANGKGRVFINNQPATVGVLRQLAPELALVHAQSETLIAFDAEQQRLLLDRFGDLSSEEVANAFDVWRGLRTQIEELRNAEQDRMRLVDLWSFQSREIEATGLTDAEEDTQLEAEKRVLANAERLLTGANAAQELLYEGETSAESLLGAALRHVEDLARFDEQFRETAQQLASAKAGVEDATSALRKFAGEISASPERLGEIEDRLAALDRLKRKYGATLGEVMSFGAEVAGRLAELENRDARLRELEAQLATAAKAYEAAAHRLSEERVAAARKLGKVAERQINELAMQARFAVDVVSDKAATAWAAHGWDSVECRIATNPGEPVKPLTEIASGGEMSRVMLALKVSVEEGAAAAAKRKRTALPRTLVFDEIDIGIGGRAAEAVGQKLKTLSRAQQVLCITHLPQIAAFADQHFLIEKSERRGRTQTGVRQMERPERVEEIARMLSGANLTETSLRHAEQMLASSV
ncbi:DNA repair protein RecN [Granulicella mallensis]|uniref:DNA repair protein RecN n=1 Tax=Granulicella mallensis (strain ATCC BAA-1857 / DSM 23137 / MP5ACTX8) TaxID=682795 RepID=G8NZ34_GRAMM|nr:DNA repair protein RecN [Granulicella mallensis]AEU35686.1 DNA repair protein RecN [Granulicella mallensis MP5ACTX8]